MINSSRLNILQSSLNVIGSLIPDSGNQKNIRVVNNSNKTVPTKKDGKEYKINNIREIPFQSLNLY